MGVNVFPAASGGASYSSQPPASASSVLLDGQLVTASSISTSVTGTGAPWLLYANGAGTTTFTVGSDTYSVPAGLTVGTSAYTGSKSVSVATTYTPPASFTASTFSSGANWFGICYGNGLFVAVGGTGSTNYGAYSSNGKTWTASTMPSSSSWYAVTYGNGYFVAVAANTTAGAYSTNGTTWTASTMPSAAQWQSVTYGLIGATNYYVAIAGNLGTAAAYSTNGTTWTSSSLPSSLYWATITFGNGYFVAVASAASGFVTTTVSAYSSNGTTWTSSTLPSSQYWFGTAYGLVGSTSTFVAVAQSTTAGAYSTNGTSWTASTMPSSATWNNVAYGNGYFVAVAGGTSAGAYSTNGTTWTALTMPSSSSWYGIAYGNGVFAATTVSGGTAGAYYSFSPLPVAYGIYNGATVRA